MAERQNYPDSSGGRWDAPLPNRRPEPAERPGFVDRTEPMGRPDRPQPANDVSLDELMASRSRRTPFPEQAAPVSGPQWQGGMEPDALHGDPELAAAAGVDAYRPQSPVSGQPVSGGHPEPAGQQYGAMDEPTRLHNPVTQQAAPPPHPAPPPVPAQAGGQNRRGYPEQVAEGVYRRSRPGLGVLLAVVAVAMIALVGGMLIATVGGTGLANPSAVVSAALAFAGIPLTAWGLYPLLGMGSQAGPDHYSALLRAPYVHLLTGLVLLVAAGLAA
ncbi:hypothetical protein LX16_0550 [Stackebrandtia albiflava]|uniref:Uncharacterized protein n=1 Tax=Stackebrandtia albiflava TaxID=406432 RepID=A0A562VAM1_9ACTN|nr:hypothetical protein [Stackebrandtia albiflava]TWJ14857.1 hypothetical protein LX16_0550 [Stackebrandtia albiflava]